MVYLEIQSYKEHMFTPMKRDNITNNELTTP